MLIIRDQIEATEKRYTNRRAEREDNQRKIKTGSILQADTSARVEKRLKRLVQEGSTTAATDMETGRARLRERLGFERVIGKSDLISVNYLEIGLHVARTVGRIHIRTSSLRTVGYGTGFLVSPRLLMTNHHVLSDATEAATSLVEFNYQDAPDGSRVESTRIPLDPATFFLTDPGLDFTLVAVRDDAEALRGYGWNPLIMEEGKVIVGEYLTIIQHPQGEPKQIAMRENRLIDVLPDFLHYETDTAQGSSGSPVFNDAWEVVALHHMGVPKRDANGNYLQKDGTLWQDGMDDSLIDWTANEGARASRIGNTIKTQVVAPGFSAAKCALCDPVFATREESLPSETSRLWQRSPALIPSVTVHENGTATWVVPLEVSVRVGEHALSAPLAPMVQPPSRPTGPAKEPGKSEPGAAPIVEPEPPPSPELQDALEEAARGRQRPYYEKPKDDANREQYYKEVTDASRQSLFTRLSGLVRETHTEEPAYRPTKYVYPWVDLQPNRKIRSIYSGRGFEPEELIREDFRIAARRERLREAFLQEAAITGRSPGDALDLLEASLPYNCEHVVPQSWFRKEEPMRGDLHHLFACESGCNSFRGNTPYFDFSEDEEALRDQCGRRQDTRFEPEAGKGPVARAVLYFLLRYPGEINQTTKEYSRERLEILLKWHRAEPPGEYELHRNAAIFEIQGNRNPLIDFPDMAERIAFELGLGE